MNHCDTYARKYKSSSKSHSGLKLMKKISEIIHVNVQFFFLLPKSKNPQADPDLKQDHEPNFLLDIYDISRKGKSSYTKTSFTKNVRISPIQSLNFLYFAEIQMNDRDILDDPKLIIRDPDPQPNF